MHALIGEHVERTDSPVGRRVLDEWEVLRSHFVKVFPADYKRVLNDLAAQEDAQTYEADEEQGNTVDVVGVPDVRTEDGE